MKKLVLSISLICLVIASYAQVRYLDDIFTVAQVQKATDVVYGQNYYFLNYPPAPAGTSSNNPQIADLQMDVYTPPGSDTAQHRPLVILLHTGSFLPRYFNGFPVGRKDDSTIVELSHRFVQKGYVVAAINYRLGWNPLASTQVERTRLIINAVYRAIHDAQTAVRFFKKDAATADTYKIDPERIFMIGQGSGGFISLAYSFLTQQSETALPKFLDGGGASVIDTSLVGFVDGIGGLYNNYNHPGYSNNVCMVGNYGGAIGDISWMNNIWPGVPVASLHCRKDQFSPIDSGNVVVPATGQVVVFVHGSRTVVRKAVQQGLNSIWVNHVFTDPFSLRAYALNPAVTTEGLFQFEIADIPASSNQEAAPWEWWDSTASTQQATSEGAIYASVVHQNGLDGNPNMSATKARKYCDTIVGFLAPRMLLVINNPTLAVEENHDVQYAVFPNPVLESLTIKLSDNDLIQYVSVIDINGKVVLTLKDINSNYYILNRNGIHTGTYFLNVRTNQGEFVHKVILN
jgi:acetyl esterase/lipase